MGGCRAGGSRSPQRDGKKESRLRRPSFAIVFGEADPPAHSVAEDCEKLARSRSNQMKARLRILCALLFVLPSSQMMADATRTPTLGGTDNLKVPDAKERETQADMQYYFRANGIPASTVLRVGMNLDEFVKVLGEPTKRYQTQKGRVVNGKSEGPHEDWLEWYHNPRGMHVAPLIRVRIEDGVIQELRAGRL